MAASLTPGGRSIDRAGHGTTPGARSFRRPGDRGAIWLSLIIPGLLLLSSAFAGLGAGHSDAMHATASHAPSASSTGDFGVTASVVADGASAAVGVPVEAGSTVGSGDRDGPSAPVLGPSVTPAAVPAGSARTADPAPSSTGITLVVSPTSGPVGTLLTFSGANYPHSTVVKVTWSRGAACSATSLSNGTFSCKYAIPAAGFGPHVFTATASNGKTATASFSVVASLSVSPSSGSPGSTATFSGMGYAAASTVSVSWSLGTACNATTSNATSSSAGSFSCTFTVPAAPIGKYTFTGVASAGGKATTSFTITPVLTVSPTSGPVGGILEFTGTNYTANLSVVVSLNGTTACSGTANPLGQFTCSFTVPASTAGVYTFVGTDAGGNFASAKFRVVPRLVATPSSGPVGSAVVFDGTGFAADSNINVSLGATVDCSAKASALGSFACGFVIPALPVGAHVFNGTDPSQLHAAGATFTVTPQLTATPSSGEVGTSVAFTGTGYAKASPAAVTWAAGTACSAVTGANGSFLCTFTIPTTSKGTHEFTGTDGAGDSAQAAFTVATVLTANPSFGPVGTTIAFDGSNYSANSAVTVSWDGGNACGATTNSTGSFSCSFVLPAASAGAHAFTGTDASSNYVSTTFTVLPTLAVSPGTGTVGTSITFSGTGFAGTSAVTVTGSSGTACTANTSPVGSFRCAFTVPPAAAGALSFTGTDGAGNSAGTSFTVVPQLTAAPATGSVGSSFEFVGTGFARGSTVTVTWSGGTACSAVPTTSVGGFTCNFTLPVTTAGPHSFRATDLSANTASTAVSVAPLLRLSPSRGLVGTFVSFSALGFAPTSAIAIGWSLGSACRGTTNASGSFGCTFNIPSTSPAMYAFNATDAASDSATATFTVIPLVLTVIPGTGPVGTVVTFTGSNWAPDSSVTVSWGGGTACAAAPTNSTGSFGCSFTIPVTTAGAHAFTGTDPTGNTTSTSFVVTPRLGATPASGPVGTIVTFPGNGYAGGSPVTVSWASGVACTSTTSASGVFVCTFTVPAAPAGPHTFTGTDGSSNQALTSFLVTPTLSASPTSGSAGTVVTLSGSGYASSSPVTVGWSAGTACTATTSTVGSFGCSLALPPATGGSHVFVATDGTGNSASTSVTVVARLTSAPTPAAAGSNVTFSGTGFAGRSPVTVSWSGGTACQVAATSADGSFNCTFKVPATTAGAHAFVGTDGSSNTAATTVTVVPTLTVSPSRGPVGTAVTFSGEGYAANSTVRVTWVGGTACSGTAGASGSFGCPFTIPSTAPGPYTFSGTDAVSNVASVAFTVSPFVSVAASSGPVGTVVTVSGSNFAVDSAVSAEFLGGVVCSTTTSGTGAFSCSFPVPAATAGPHAVSASDAAGNTASAAFTVTPRLTVSPASGPVGTSMTFNGTGFGFNATVSISSIAGVRCQGTQSGTSGSFSCVIVMPAATAGAHRFTAIDSAESLDSAFVLFTVTASLFVSPSSGPVGTFVTFSGAGYAGNSTVTVSWSAGTACAAVSNGAGNVVCTFTVPGTSLGSHRFTGTDASSDTAAALFVVVPQLSASLASGPVGTVVRLTGSGYDPTTVVNVTWNGGVVCSATTSATGAFACSVTILPTPAGAHAFNGAEAHGASATSNFTVTPSFSESKSSGPVGTGVSLSGAGFARSTSLTISWNGASACLTTTNTSGSFACSFVVPATPAGAHTLLAADVSGNSASVVFTVLPTVTAGPTGGPVGTVVTFTGSGYAANSALTVTWSSGVACTQTTNSTGGFACSFSLPAATAGAHSFTATDRSSNAASTSVTVTSLLTVSPTKGLVGAVVTFTAEGFAAASAISVSWHAGRACSGTTGASGNFSCTFRVPSSAPGVYAFTATDAASNAASVGLTIVPLLTVGPASGPVGTTVRVTGSNFAAASAVTVVWAGTTVCTQTSNATGAFACSFPLAPIGAGVGTLTATDGAGNSATASFAVQTLLSVSGTSGPVGTSVVFTGTGYDPSSPVTVAWALGTACTGESSAVGSFSCAFTLPSSPAGAHTFNGSDPSGAFSTTVFTVVPQLLLGAARGPVATVVPLSASGFAAGRTINITWGSSTACSGTTGPAGNFSCTFKIPATPPGPSTFSATDAAANRATATFTVVPVLTVSSGSGPVGSSVTFTGTNFASSSSVSVTGPGGVTLCTQTSTGSGGFACTAAIPAGSSGVHAYSATDGSGNTASVSFSITAKLSVTSPSGPVGAPETFVGTGFAASASATVSWSGGTVCTAATSAAGSFSCAVTVPAATTGSHAFTATDLPSSDSASASVLVTAALTLSASTGTVATVLTFTGSGFAGTSTVTVTWSQGAACSSTTNASGGFTCRFSVSPAPAGTYPFTATDASGNLSRASFTLESALTIGPSSGPVGTSVSLSGTGFGPNEPVEVTWGSAAVCAPTTDANGSFGCTFEVPPAPEGSQQFEATDTATHSANATFAVAPALSVSAGEGPEGTSPTFSGTGFAADSAVTVVWARGTACTATTSVAGSFACPFLVPRVQGGAYPFTATDASGNSATSHFTVTATLAVSPASAAVGTTVTFTGTGYAGTTLVNVSQDSTVACGAITASSGGFNCTFTIGAMPSGPHSFSATDRLSNSATAVETVVPSLTITPVPVAVGGNVNFTGAGFAGVSSVTVSWSGGTACTAVTTTSKGVFSCSFKLPPAAAGAHVFTAADLAGDTASGSATVTQSLSASPTSARSGSSITFSGNGFAADSAVSVTWTRGVACSTISNASGGFACVFDSHGAPAGNYTFTARDAAGGLAATPVGIAAAPAGPVNNQILGLDPVTFWIVVIVIVAIAAVAAVIVVRTLKGSGRPPTW